MEKRIAVFFGLMLFHGMCYSTPDILWSNCFDVTGQSVVLIDEPGNNRLEATFHNEDPSIVWDSEFTNQLSKETQSFLYAHACAHHSLGHTYSLFPENGEEQADCWAANTLVNVGVFIKEDLHSVEKEINQLPENLQKIAVVQRTLSLSNCFQTTRNASVEDVYKDFEPECKQVMVEEEYEEIEYIIQPEQVPCEHCTCLRWGECNCAHAFDTVDRSVELRVTKMRYVPQEVCGTNTPEDY